MYTPYFYALRVPSRFAPTHLDWHDSWQHGGASFHARTGRIGVEHEVRPASARPLGRRNGRSLRDPHQTSADKVSWFGRLQTDAY